MKELDHCRTIGTPRTIFLIEHGEVRRGRLGVGVQDLTPALAEAMGLELAGGAVVSEVEPGSAAALAGLRPGDVIARVDGQPILDAGDLRNLIGVMPAGTGLDLVLYRAGQERSVRVRIGEVEQAAARPR
jgi:serine protease DegQ